MLPRHIARVQLRPFAAEAGAAGAASPPAAKEEPKEKTHSEPEGGFPLGFGYEAKSSEGEWKKVIIERRNDDGTYDLAVDEGSDPKDRPRWQSYPREKIRKKKSDEKKWGLSGWLWRITAGIAGIYVVYTFRDQGFSVHRTERHLVKKFMSLPLYWPPDKTLSQKNTTIEDEDLHMEIFQPFVEWLILMDLQESEGITRDEVLELMTELGFDEQEKAAKEFLSRGVGQLEERRRLSGCSLQECVELLANLALGDEARKDRSFFGLQARPGLLRARLGDKEVAIIQARVDKLMLSAPENAVNTHVAGFSNASPAMRTANARSLGDARGASHSLSRWQQSSGVAEHAPAEAFDDDEDERLELARLRKLEQELRRNLATRGSLSPAEEVRLEDCLQQIAKLSK